MTKLNHVFLLFVVIVLEGYVVLSSELLAIRQTIPYVGSGTDTVSIIIAAVLMPLAFGYYAGGRYKPGFHNGKYRSVRQKLIHNIFIAMVILLIGLSYALLHVFFQALLKFGIENRVVLTTIYATLFLVVPVYLLGQTIPLVSNYFSKEKLSQITGRILFFSTVGSFLGAVFSTLVLMTFLGVHHTTAIIFIILALLIFLLSKKKFSEWVLYGLCIAIGGLILNSDYVMEDFDIIENNQYNTITFHEKNGQRFLSLNNNASSMLSNTGQKHRYVEFIEHITINKLPWDAMPIDILVIGAGGFTFGYGDIDNQYDFVDIDPSLQRLSEEYLLKEKLTPNKKFYPVPARAFLTKTDKKYDLILLDTYQGDLTLPEHLITREFFLQVKNVLKEEGVVVGNFIASPGFRNRFSRRVDNTFRSVFPFTSRHAARDNYWLWEKDPNKISNMIYVYRHNPDETEEDMRTIYTDNKNQTFIDKPKTRR